MHTERHSLWVEPHDLPNAQHPLPLALTQLRAVCGADGIRASTSISGGRNAPMDRAPNHFTTSRSGCDEGMA
jgi:hypothetical protein